MKFLIVGLGNIGDEYANTRHNIGFKMLDAFAESAGVQWEDKRYGFVGRCRVKNAELVLLKPSTFMNLSGMAVRYWLLKENIPLENLFVLVDDLNLPFGTIRMRKSGSAGGHNGLRNIEQCLCTPNYCRLRFGIGNEYTRGQFRPGRMARRRGKSSAGPTGTNQRYYSIFLLAGNRQNHESIQRKIDYAFP